MPWQDRISEAGERIENVGGLGTGNRTVAAILEVKKEIYALAQIPGRIAMCEGGGHCAPRPADPDGKRLAGARHAFQRGSGRSGGTAAQFIRG
jgi:hypothetical protein